MDWEEAFSGAMRQAGARPLSNGGGWEEAFRHAHGCSSQMPKSSSMAPPEPAQGGTELNEYGELPTWKRLANRAKLLGNPKEFYDRTIESVWKTHGDVMEERLGDFRGREAMGDSLDKEHNTWNLYENWKHKEDLRKALHELGKNRYPINLENKGTEK